MLFFVRLFFISLFPIETVALTNGKCQDFGLHLPHANSTLYVVPPQHSEEVQYITFSASWRPLREKIVLNLLVVSGMGSLVIDDVVQLSPRDTAWQSWQKNYDISILKRNEEYSARVRLFSEKDDSGDIDESLHLCSTDSNPFRILSAPWRLQPTVKRLQYRSLVGSYLNELDLLGNGVEIGVQEGKFSEAIMDLWKGNRLTLIDPWEQQQNYDDGMRCSKNFLTLSHPFSCQCCE